MTGPGPAAGRGGGLRIEDLPPGFLKARLIEAGDMPPERAGRIQPPRLRWIGWWTVWRYEDAAGHLLGWATIHRTRRSARRALAAWVNEGRVEGYAP